ncbi:MAG: alpha/beta hydrolase [Burkholderiaceae bacterium]
MHATPESTNPDSSLDPHSRDLLLRVGALAAAVPEHELTPQRRRALMRESVALHTPDGNPLSVRREELEVPLPGRSLPARLYRPVAAHSAGAASDVLLVFFHGGGWVIGDLETHDHVCAFLTQRLGCALLSVEYRKAPEHPFPAPCDDAAEAYAWAATQAAAWHCSRLAVAGDSAGAHLAAHAMYANPQLATAAALLFYPVADMDFATSSYVQRGDGPGLTRASMRYFWEQLAGRTPVADDARAVLMRQRWQRRPPPTVVSLAWHDPLHDEGLAYAELLRAAGADVRVHVARDMSHGFLRQSGVIAAARGHVESVTDDLLACLRPAAAAR